MRVIRNEVHSILLPSPAQANSAGFSRALLNSPGVSTRHGGMSMDGAIIRR
ncbi:hypothetical protein GbCGDNIH6_8209 [Granulibacter bethesdensis]|nr:hypothetical protein GbCGDNIH6_8209 [Granulibacter bethesdensis]